MRARHLMNAAPVAAAMLAVSGGALEARTSQSESRAEVGQEPVANIYDLIGAARQKAVDENPHLRLVGPSEESINAGLSLAVEGTSTDDIKTVRYVKRAGWLHVSGKINEGDSTMGVAVLETPPEATRYDRKRLLMSVDGDALMNRIGRITLAIKKPGKRAGVPLTQSEDLPQQEDLSPQALAPTFYEGSENEERARSEADRTYSFSKRYKLTPVLRQAIRAGKLHIRFDNRHELRNQYQGKINEPRTERIYGLFRVKAKDNSHQYDLSKLSINDGQRNVDWVRKANK